MTKRSKSKDRQKQIVAVTLALLATNSIEQLTTRQIASVLGISQPALFRHFPSRDALLLAVVNQVQGDLAELTEKTLATGTAEEQLSQLMTKLFSFIEEHPGLTALLFSTSLPDAGPVRQALRQIMTLQLTLVTELVREGQRRGDFQASIPAGQAATAFIGLIQGAVFQWRLADRAQPLGQDAAVMFKLWLRGVGTRRAANPGDPGIAQTVQTSIELGECTTPGINIRSSCDGDADDGVGNRAGDGEAVPHPRIAELDVRPTLAGGEDPQLLIFAELKKLSLHSVLKIIAPFRPTPLVALLQQRGHSITVTEYGPLHFQAELVIGGELAIDDLRDLEPPEPLERVLEEGMHLDGNEAYLARLPRFPRLLLPQLEKRNLNISIYEEPDDTVLILLRKKES